MSFAALLPPVPDALLEQVILSEECLTLVVRFTTAQMPCPRCGLLSRQIHSRARRTLYDVPVGGRRVRLSLQVRRFFCRTPTCPRRTFRDRCLLWLRHGRVGPSDSRRRCARSATRSAAKRVPAWRRI